MYESKSTRKFYNLQNSAFSWNFSTNQIFSTLHLEHIQQLYEYSEYISTSFRLVFKNFNHLQKSAFSKNFSTNQKFSTLHLEYIQQLYE